MKKIESVIAFGDSHTAGCELNDIKITEYYKNNNSFVINDNITKEFAYPNKLAEMLNVPCYNYAMSAGSNDRSLRLLPKAVLDHPNSLVLFGWTNSFRKEFFRPEKTHVAQDLDQFVQVGIHLYNIKNPYKELLDSISIDKNSINKTYVEKIAYPYNNLEVYSFYVEAVCQLYSSNHYHLLLHRNDKLPKNLKNNFIFDNFDNFVDWCEFKKFKKFEANHYEEKAHIELANLIYKDLMKKVDIDF